MNDINIGNNQDADNMGDLNIASEKKDSNNKKPIIFVVAAILIIGVGIGGYFVFNKSATAPVGKCGDSVCDDFEKANPNACPSDCEVKNNESYQCPQYTPPAPSFYDNCKKQNGKVESGNKDDNGCQLPPQCVLSESQSTSGNKNISENSPFGFVQGSFDTNYKYDTSYKNMLDLGVYWDRPFEGHVATMWNDIETERGGKGFYDFTRSDEIFSKVFETNNKINIFISLNIVNKLYGSSVSLENKDGNPYPTDPNAITAYKNFVRAIVKRYSANIKYWMVGQNEFDDLNPLAKPLMAYSDEGLNKMAEYTKAACGAIKEVCPDCRSVMGGSVVPITSFSKKGDRISVPDGKVVEVQEDGVYFKLLPKVKNECENLIIDYHFWPRPNKKDYLVQKTIIDNILKIKPSAEIWNTESGSVDSYKEFTEYDQSRDITRIYVYALAHGQKKIFWTNTLEYDWTKDDSSEFDYIGLINNPKNNDGLSHKKLSYYTYKKMVEVLEGSDWDNIQTIQEAGGVYIYKFTKNSKSIWVAWNDNSAEKQITISGITSNQVKITETVPKYESGKEVKDYDTAFKTENKQTTNNKLNIILNDNPIFVENN